MNKFLYSFFSVISNIVSSGSTKSIAEQIRKMEKQSDEVDAAIEKVKKEIESLKEDIKRETSSMESSLNTLEDKIETQDKQTSILYNFYKGKLKELRRSR